MSYSAHANKKKKKKKFQPGDLVWIHLQKERFPTRHKSKLMSRVDGPFENDNAYKLYLLGDYGALATFNVADLTHMRKMITYMI